MDILNDTKAKKVHKPEIEQVVREQMEFTLLGTYTIGRGYKLFSCNPTDFSVEQITVKQGDFIQCELVRFPGGRPSGEWVWFDPENFNVSIDSRVYYFQALNLRTAKERVGRFKAGKLKDLFNLKKPNPNGIDFFEKL